jgi:hypothetical protein
MVAGAKAKRFKRALGITQGSFFLYDAVGLFDCFQVSGEQRLGFQAFHSRVSLPRDSLSDSGTTIKLGANEKNAVAMWGPYEIDKKAFDLAVKRKRLLDAGTIKYRADDRLYRKDRVAISCFHAMAGLNELFPNGGLFGTGFKMWGLNGTARVLIEYTKTAHFKHVLLEPVDVKKDRYGFVYAPTRNGHGLYNPFINASAYRR